MSSLPSNIRIIDLPSPGAAVHVGIINAYNALQIPAYHRAIHFLSGNLMSFPRTVRKNDTNCESADIPHPLDTLLMLQPNQLQDAATFWTTFYFHAAHWGNGIAEIIRDPQTFQPIALQNIMPGDVAPVRYDPGDGSGMQQLYVLRNKRILFATDVIHLSRLSFDGMIGLCPIDFHDRALRRAHLVQAYVTKFLERGSVIRGSIEFPEGTTDEQVQQVVDLIRRFYSGIDSERDLITLSGGAKLNNAAVTPQNSQLVEQGSLSIMEIARMTGVPPQYLYEFQGVQYNNGIEAMGQDVVRYTFRPWIVTIENQLSVKLLSPSELAAGLRIHVDPDALLRGDRKTQADILLSLKDSGVINTDEVRVKLGYKPLGTPEAQALKVKGDTHPPAEAGGTSPTDPPQAGV